MEFKITKIETKWVQVEQTYKIDEDGFVEGLIDSMYYYGFDDTPWNDPKKETQTMTEEKIREWLKHPSEHYWYNKNNELIPFMQSLEEYIHFLYTECEFFQEYGQEPVEEKNLQIFDLEEKYQDEYSINKKEVVDNDLHSFVLYENMDDTPDNEE